MAGTTAKATDAMKYDFEDGTQGWENLEGCVKLWNTTDFKCEGFRSIGLYANAISSSSPGYARVRPPASLGAGATVTANVSRRLVEEYGHRACLYPGCHREVGCCGSDHPRSVPGRGPASP